MTISVQLFTDLLQDNYSIDDNGVWKLRGEHSFKYSDGDEVENRLFEHIKTTSDLSLASNELQQKISDWPSEYHFTPQRANLLSGFQFDEINSVLEIGSGCGAITRFFGEQGKQVLALEGSDRRAAITRARCNELENVTVCCDSFDTFAINTRFDCVTLIGVLEYSPAFISGEDPIVVALKKARSLLNDGGVLIVAIENQLGLKYFNGCTEDHSGVPFTGVNDSYQPGTFCTFGRVELTQKISEAGFQTGEFAYPFPDYKLPQLIVREGAIVDEELDLSFLIGQYNSRDYAYSSQRIFHENRTWPLIARNDLVRDFANSFLVFAYNNPQGDTLDRESWLVKTFSCPRKKEYITSNTFYKDHGTLKVLKEKKYPNFVQTKRDALVKLNVGPEVYIAGTPYSLALKDTMRSEGALAQYAQYLKPWIEYLFLQALPEQGSSVKSRRTLPGSYFDCIPANLIIGNSLEEFEIIDQEWEFVNSLEVGFVIFRGIYRDIRTHLLELSETNLLDNRTLFQIVQYVFSDHGLHFDETLLKQYINLEIDIQLELIIYPTSKKQLVEYLLGFCHEVRQRKLSFGHCLVQDNGIDVPDIYSQYNRMINECELQSKSIEDLTVELDVMKNCWSWKIGRFLTTIPRLLRKKN